MAIGGGVVALSCIYGFITLVEGNDSDPDFRFLRRKLVCVDGFITTVVIQAIDPWGEIKCYVLKSIYVIECGTWTRGITSFSSLDFCDEQLPNRKFLSQVNDRSSWLM